MADGSFIGSVPPISCNIALRDYQRDTLVRITEEGAAGHTRILLVAPTGAGKTAMFSVLVLEAYRRGAQVLIIAHTQELINQAWAMLYRVGIPAHDVGVFRGKSNRKTKNLNARVLIASVQGKRGLAQLPHFNPSLVIIDEAHHCLAKTYQELLAMYPTAMHIGATATPWWGRGKGLKGYFQALVQAATVRLLTALGFLMLARVFSHPGTNAVLDYRGVPRTKNGDFQERALSRVMNVPKLIGNILEHWRSHADGRATIVFASSLEHARSICASFKKDGVSAAVMYGAMPDAERVRILGTSERYEDDGTFVPRTVGAFERGEVKVLVNYNLFTEGYDAPWVGCIVLARPTRSVRIYLQAVGRGLRCFEGKTGVVVLDHAGLCMAFGLPEADRPCSLEGLERGASGRAAAGEGEGAGEETEGAEQAAEARGAGERLETGVGRDGRLPVVVCPSCGLNTSPRTKTCPTCKTDTGEAVGMEEHSGVLEEVVREVFGEKAPLSITLDGVTRPVAEWSAITGLSQPCIYKRAKEFPNEPEKILYPDRLNQSRPMTAFGKTQTPQAWAKELGCSVNRILMRKDAGYSDEEALNLNYSKRNRVLTYKGKTQPLYLWSKELGIPVTTLDNRLKSLSVDEAFSRPRAAQTPYRVSRRLSRRERLEQIEANGAPVT